MGIVTGTYQLDKGKLTHERLYQLDLLELLFDFGKIDIHTDAGQHEQHVRLLFIRHFDWLGMSSLTSASSLILDFWKNLSPTLRCTLRNPHIYWVLKIDLKKELTAFTTSYYCHCFLRVQVQI